MRVRGPDGAPGLHRPRARRARRSTPTASSGPATWATSATTAIVVLTGRLKDVIVRKGENISAKEIEDLLYTHPKVEDVAVIGLPDPERGERVCAVVQLSEGADPLDLRRDGRVLPRRRADDPEDPRAARRPHRSARAPATGKIVKTKLRDEYAGKSWEPQRQSRPGRR